MPRAPFPVLVGVFALACTSDPSDDESASETADESTTTGTDEVTDTDESTGTDDETTGTEATDTETTDTEEETTDTGGPYGHGNLHPDCMGDAPQVVLETSLGDMTVQLDAVRAPISVANFLGYVSSGYYDGTIFHRVVDSFVIQGGGFEPGMIQKPVVGTIPLEIHPELRHVDGAIAMARRQEPDTADSQWYICDGPQAFLDDMYAVFGVVIEGFDVRDAISGVAVQDVPAPYTDVPIEDVVVERAYCVMQ
jgi:cyclophilin family peptidyl-prolyl cis-trans isomerase